MQAGATEDMINRLEGGDRRFSGSLLQRVTRVLHVDPDVMVPAAGQAFAAKRENRSRQKCWRRLSV